MARISEGLQGLVVPVDAVALHPRNPRDGDVGVLSESLKRFGQLRPIVVQKSTMFVVAGNHVLRAARALGWQTIAANVIDMDDTEALAYLVADNRLAELAWYDQQVLEGLLTEQALAGNLAGTGYEADDVDDVLRSRTGVPKLVYDTVAVADTIAWDSVEQQKTWRNFERWTRDVFEGETFPQRLDEFIRGEGIE